MNRKGVWETYIMRPRFDSELSDNGENGWYAPKHKNVAECMLKELPEALHSEFDTFNPEDKDLYIKNSYDARRNECFRDLIAGAETYFADVWNATNGIDAENYVGNCQSCYERCFGELTRELASVSTWEEFQQWVENGVIDKCACPQTCQFNDFSSLVEGIFLEENEYSQALNQSGCFKAPVKQCFDFTTRDSVKIEVLANVNFDTFNCYWGVLPLQYQNQDLPIPVPFDAENPLNRPRDRIAEEDTVNRCLVTDMMNVDWSLVNNVINPHATDEQFHFEQCRPCYESCMEQAADITTLTTIEEFEEWFSPSTEKLCASQCDAAAGRPCYSWSKMMSQYFDTIVSPDQFTPNNNFKTCLAIYIQQDLRAALEAG